MAQRRPLIVGVNAPDNTDPEAVRAFVTQERPHEPRSHERRELTVLKETVNDTEPIEPAPPVAAEPKPTTMKRGKAKLPVGLIPVTVRLRPEIAGALKRASLERQLAGEDVFTQQDLVEQALEPWLRSHGHL
jgi:hypothetical protein